MILVLGSNGFIATTLCRWLETCGIDFHRITSDRAGKSNATSYAEILDDEQEFRGPITIVNLAFAYPKLFDRMERENNTIQNVIQKLLETSKNVHVIQVTTEPQYFTRNDSNDVYLRRKSKDLATLKRQAGLLTEIVVCSVVSKDADSKRGLDRFIKDRLRKSGSFPCITPDMNVHVQTADDIAAAIVDEIRHPTFSVVRPNTTAINLPRLLGILLKKRTIVRFPRGALMLLARINDFVFVAFGLDLGFSYERFSYYQSLEDTLSWHDDLISYLSDLNL